MSDEPFTLPEEFTIAGVGETYSQLRKYFDPSLETQLKIDASQVIRIDTAAVQLLFFIKSGLENVGKTIHWQGMSGPFRDALDRLGMTQWLVTNE